MGRTIVVLFIIALIGAFVLRSYADSLFFKAPERVGVVLYGPQTYVYLLSSNSASYRLKFSHDQKIPVPGGYGLYRVGSLGKLSTLEADPSLLSRAFSITTSSFVPYYFYPDKLDQVYDKESAGTALLTDLPLNRIFLDKSNANFLDRIYFALFFSRLGTAHLIDLDPEIYTTKNEFNEKIFDDDSYLQNTAGYFYTKRFRLENATVQILYNESYETGERLGTLLDGMGIRVVDIAQNPRSNGVEPCRIVVEADLFPYTTQALSDFFGCPVERGNVEVSDILFILGNRERQWEIIR